MASAKSKRMSSRDGTSASASDGVDGSGGDVRIKAARIKRELDALYPPETIVAPLNSEGNFQHLVAVMLSAQTTDKKVNEVTPALFKMAPTPQKMAACDAQTIQHTIREIGLAPTKAKRLRELSSIICESFNGEVPNTFEGLESLPGVGHKTASVIMSQCFGMPAFPVDTHIHRLAARWGLSSGKNVEQTERDLKLAFDECDWNAIHLQIIFYGRCARVTSGRRQPRRAALSERHALPARIDVPSTETFGRHNAPTARVTGPRAGPPSPHGDRHSHTHTLTPQRVCADGHSLFSCLGIRITPGNTAGQVRPGLILGQSASGQPFGTRRARLR